MLCWPDFTAVLWWLLLDHKYYDVVNCYADIFVKKHYIENLRY